MKTLNELSLLRAIETFVLNDDKIKVYNYLKSIAERQDSTSVLDLKIKSSTKGDDTAFEYLEIWEPFEHYGADEILELIEVEYKANLAFADEVLKCK